ncbi:MAG TPA: hypothetical protein VGQ99_04105 [Tepidisphaeraceae bacterium]|jgi:DNA-binding CsgD family transcriptional regulator|nr:hypothetical protein [Tepidisphaeraceae bacterium]
MLAEEVERAIVDAWVRVRNEILSDPDELRRRLARRRSKSLTRPPRAWCIAIRASDRRITPAHWVITPEHAMDLDHPAHPYEPIEHEVTIQTHALRRCCRPVRIARPSEDFKDVAKRLGVSPDALWYARSRVKFDEHSYKGLGGKRGRAIPLIYRSELLDPGSASFHRPPHAIWGSMWEWLVEEVPQDFEQAVMRRPYFERPTGKSACPTGEVYKDEMLFRGWRWVCPGCKKEVKTIYYPIPVRTMFDRWFTDPVIQKRLSDADLPHAPPAVFACHQCHDIQYFSSVRRAAWNELIGYLTAGLLYGQEVARPGGFVPERRKTLTRQLNRAAPVRRKVLARLSNGWSNAQIARDLEISIYSVYQHVYQICREEEVADRHALAEKLRFAVSPPLNQWERAAARRFLVREMLMRDCSYQEMCEKLGVGRPVVHDDVKATYRLYGVKGKGRAMRRALAEKLGMVFVSKAEEIRRKVAELREMGLSGKEVAREMGMSEVAVAAHGQKLKRAAKNAAVAAQIQN